jgi:hypothetical protein
MARSQVLRGEMTQGDRPEWGPLLDAVGEAVTSDFMWMFLARAARSPAWTSRTTREDAA